MERNWIATPFLLLALGALLYLLFVLLAPYAAPVTWAAILAVVFNPVHRLLVRSMPRYPTLAAATTTLLVLALAVIPSLVLSGVVANEGAKGYRSLAAFVRDSPLESLDQWSTHPVVEPLWNWAKTRMAEGDVQPTSLALSGLRWVSDFVAERAATVARNVFAFFISMGIMTFTLFFALRDGPSMLRYLEESIPMDPADRSRIIERLRVTILAVVQGMTATAVVQGVLVTIGCWLAGVPYASVLGVAAGLLAFLPVGGAAIVWVPTVIGLVIAGSYGAAAFLALWGAALVSSVDNLLRPLMIGSQAELSTPMLFFGILGGLQAFGFIGLFVGPVILAACACLVTIYRERVLAIPPPAAAG